jgi:ubiquitin-conjugating enzyme (huntingtin interacting protein 2)
MSSAATRISKELAEVSKADDVSGVRASPISSDINHLQGTIKGPAGTPYEGTVHDTSLHPSYFSGIHITKDLFMT